MLSECCWIIARVWCRRQRSRSWKQHSTALVYTTESPYFSKPEGSGYQTPSPIFSSHRYSQRFWRLGSKESAFEHSEFRQFTVFSSVSYTRSVDSLHGRNTCPFRVVRADAWKTSNVQWCWASRPGPQGQKTWPRPRGSWPWPLGSWPRPRGSCLQPREVRPRALNAKLRRVMIDTYIRY